MKYELDGSKVSDYLHASAVILCFISSLTCYYFFFTTEADGVLGKLMLTFSAGVIRFIWGAGLVFIGLGYGAFNLVLWIFRKPNSLGTLIILNLIMMLVGWSYFYIMDIVLNLIINY